MRAMLQRATTPFAAVAATSRVAGRPERAIAAWLYVCCALVFAMVVVGGITRLTHSGLSIVEWQPLVGTVPPLTDSEWNTLFDQYKQTPEYKQVNYGMPLSGFKRIFWWEYSHRLLGRAIGVVFFVPFLWFLARRRIDRRLAWQLGGIFLLGALQGGMGWYMVKSGLVDDPRVSHFRLTAHLGIALAIFSAELWIALGLLSPPLRRAPHARLARAGLALAALVFLMALTGGFVAGLHAGRAYNTFPLMNGHIVPPEIMMLDPWYENFLYNMATVQFVHRSIAWLLAVLVPIFWLRVQRAGLEMRARLASDAMLAALVLQISLGIATLLLVVPVPLAAAHQAGAVLLLATALWTAFELRRALPVNARAFA